MKKQKIADNAPEAASQTDLAQALTEAIKAAQPFRPKTILERTPQTPWSPPPGVPRAELRRPCYQHGNLIESQTVTNEEIELLNRLKPGTYCDGRVKVRPRRDGGLTIDYPVRTASQRIAMLAYGRSFKELLERIIDEQQHPERYGSRSDDAFRDAVAVV